MTTTTCRVPKTPLSCAVCGSAFSLYPSQLKYRRGRFCSKACQGKAKRTGTTIYCEMCDSPFYRHRAEQDIGVKVRQFCSRACYDQWRATNRSPNTYPKAGGVHLHRTVAASVLGRDLNPGEVVHHVDLDKQNTDPTNLAVFPDQATHVRCHAGRMSAEELRDFLLIGGHV